MTLPRVFPSVVHMLAEAVAAAPEREALVLGTERLNYRDYGRCAAGLARELQSLGLAGGRVAFVLGNSLDICISYFGIHAAGCQAVPLNPLYTPRELEQMLGDAAPGLVLYEAGLAATVEPVAEALGIAHRWRIGDGARRLTVWRGEADLDGALPLPESDSLATLQYTGGTTGRAKGVNLTHRGYATNISQREALMPSRPDRERILCVMPLFHVYASHVCLHTAAYARGTMVILPRYRPEDTVAALAGERITIFAGSPTIYTSLLNFDGFAGADLSSLYYSVSGSAALPATVLEQWEARVGTPIIEGYGQSEAGPVLTYNPLHGVRKPGSVGVTVPDTEVQIVDLDSGTRVLPVGERGEIRARGPQIMQGYRNLPKETAETLRNGWLYTGDIGEFDSDGYLYIRDRKKEMVIVSGYNVFPREVEIVLYQHPAVREAAVVGVADSYRGEIVKAFVALKTEAAASTDDLAAHCRANLAKYKIPAAIEIVPELPKTAVGKIDKKALQPRA
ncbi:MAG: long-chain fatty acid--CoA ligase [Rhodospirillaceae bacterium]|nr:long-chain fatty acid--CoA ligase [Rhodospirillaceae bacterium]